MTLAKIAKLAKGEEQLESSEQEGVWKLHLPPLASLAVFAREIFRKSG